MVYKPRDLSIEVAYFDLLAWFHEHKAPCEHKLLRVLNRDTYGWVEHAKHLPCDDKASAKGFYYRIGALLCIMYTLDGTDCHCENLIACGHYPVLVDVETLFYPRARTSNESERLNADSSAMDIMDASVFRTGLLPVWETGQGGKCFDISGLGAVEEQPTGVPIKNWVHINCDQMVLVYREGVNSPRQNCAFLKDGTTLSSGAYIDEIADGFAQMYRTLVANRNELLATNGPLARFPNCQIRFILRPTAIYHTLLEKLRHPEFLRSGADRERELEVLAQSALITPLPGEVKIPWEVYNAERTSLERYDIPYFHTYAECTTLWCEDEILATNFFQESGFSRVTRRIHGLDEQDLTTQLSFLRGALCARFDTPVHLMPNPPDPLISDTEQILSSRNLLSEAVEIGEWIQSRSIRGIDGSINWISLFEEPETERLRLEPLGYSFYNGRCGIAVFLAELARITGREEFAKSAREAIRPLITSSKSMLHRLCRAGIGGGSGIGGIVYGMLRIAEALGDQEILENSCRIAQNVTIEDIRQDREFDVIAGAAGCILGLLALYRVVHEQAILDRALACGRHLLANCHEMPQGSNSWRSSIAAQPLTGFSHGAAGIALALLRLAAVTSCPEFWQVAKKAIAYEAEVYSTAQKNWPDFRSHGEGINSVPRYMNTWCHGAPGIGLARIGCLSLLGTPEVRSDIEVALKTTLAVSDEGPDHLCCGHGGRIEFLTSASGVLRRPELFTEALRRGSAVIYRKHSNGRYRLRAQVGGDWICPAFFQRLSGIGYQFLRLAKPTMIPSALLWE